MPAPVTTIVDIGTSPSNRSPTGGTLTYEPYVCKLPAVRRTADEAAHTRQQLLDAARERFATDGFAGVSLDGLAARCGVTRGAIHHHFGDKRGVFLEVFRVLEDELNRAVVSAAVHAVEAGEDPIAAGCRSLFAFFRRPDYRQIALSDAPGVLGLLEWYRIDRETGLATMRAGVQAMADAGRIDPGLVEVLSLVVFGALTEAALTFAVGDATVSEDDVIEAVQRVLAGLAPTTVPVP
jgi:AcrR family transcriptional regulator